MSAAAAAAARAEPDAPRDYQGVPVVHVGTRLDFGLSTPHAKDMLVPQHVHYARAATGEYIALLRTQENVYVKPSLEQQRAMFRSAKTPPSNLVMLKTGVAIPILPPELYASRVVDAHKRSEKNASATFARAEPGASFARAGFAGAGRGAPGWDPAGAQRAAGAASPPPVWPEPRPAARGEAYPRFATLPAVAATDDMRAFGAAAPLPPFRDASNESELSECDDDDVRHPSLRVFSELRSTLRARAGASAMFADPFAGVATWQDIVGRYGNDACVLLFQAFNAWHPDGGGDSDSDGGGGGGMR